MTTLQNKSRKIVLLMKTHSCIVYHHKHDKLGHFLSYHIHIVKKVAKWEANNYILLVIINKKLYIKTCIINLVIYILSYLGEFMMGCLNDIYVTGQSIYHDTFYL